MARDPHGRAVDERMRVVVAGGGPAGLEGALALEELAGERIALTLVAPEAELVYRPLAVIEPFGLGEAPRVDLATMAADQGWTLVGDGVAAVDAPAHRVSTSAGGAIDYDALLLAVGAGAVNDVPGALPFRGPQDSAALARALRSLPSDRPTRVAYTAPPSATWTLPLYELALLTARWARDHAPRLEIWVVTHELRPLGVFGQAAAEAVAPRLEAAGVRVWAGVEAELVEDGRLWGAMEGGMPIDLAVALPRAVGRPPEGLPHDAEGFVPTDPYGRVAGLESVYAVGDMTTRPLRQGGLAAAQADAAAAVIAAAAGAQVDPIGYRPVLHGMLLTGEDPAWFLRAGGSTGIAAGEPPWWPPHKIAGRYLAPYLAAHDTRRPSASG